MSGWVHIIRLLRLLVPRRRRPAHELKLGSEGEVAKALWRGAFVQMKAVNTASAWPMRRRREMRSVAEARLNDYFAHLERMITAERPATSSAVTTGGPAGPERPIS